MRLTPRFGVAIGALALFAAACGSSDNPTSAGPITTSGSSSESSTTMAGDGEMMPLPDFAKAMRTSFASPAAGTMITGNEITVKVDVAGYELACDQAGKAVAEGAGHYHLLLDRSLVDMFCTPEATVSLQNVKPGKHTLEVVPALNDHEEVLDNAKELAFDFEPTNPLPEITDATVSGAPAIRIVSPTPGQVVSGDFDVVVEFENFNPSCELYGKAGVAGYGHWHVNLDTDTGPMMGMGTMLGMSCKTVFRASTVGLQAGETHSVIALLVDNSHAPFTPGIKDSVDVVVG